MPLRPGCDPGAPGPGVPPPGGVPREAGISHCTGWTHSRPPWRVGTLLSHRDPLSDTPLVFRPPGSGLTVWASREQQRVASHLVPTEPEREHACPSTAGGRAPQDHCPRGSPGQVRSRGSCWPLADAPATPSHTSQAGPLAEGGRVSRAGWCLQLRSQETGRVTATIPPPLISSQTLF